ncbi:uncharacterized protein LOC126263179 isoform X2 [Schistocerca nitens]|uniref:uncharacterized protein LOC126263179 isoform X2 n=1 Tax=Schistocerca nitens TaxID=7011 RepID=UPI0021175FC1|nr:uncharacterized protein LOC126263179 isoform X2 [Schistocerca nitens]
MLLVCTRAAVSSLVLAEQVSGRVFTLRAQHPGTSTGAPGARRDRKERSVDAPLLARQVPGMRQLLDLLVLTVNKWKQEICTRAVQSSLELQIAWIPERRILVQPGEC